MAKPIVIFDYDGTLHNCAIVYKTAFLKVYDQLVQDGLAQPRMFRDEEISQWLGYSATDMWNAFMPQLNAEQQHTYSKLESICILVYRKEKPDGIPMQWM